MRSDDDLQHLCRLASVAVSMVRNPDFISELVKADAHERHNLNNCLLILADAYVELAARQAIKPRFQVQAIAGRAALSDSRTDKEGER